MPDPAERLTVLFLPEGAHGPTNNCTGIGDELRGRGHRVVFAAEASWRGKLAPLGFEEELIELAPVPPVAPGSAQDPAPGSAPAEPQDQVQFWKDLSRHTAPVFRRSTLRQLETWVRPVWEELVAGARFCEPQLREIIARTRPDVLVEDNVIGFPAVTTAGVPFVRIVSGNPLELRSDDVPPAFSGYPAGDATDWPAFRAEYERGHRELWAEFNAWTVEQGGAPLPDLEFIPTGDLNLHVYPEELDYPRERALGPRWQRLESCVRRTDSPVALPAMLTDRRKGSALIYLSLGSMGSADLKLMRRVIGALAQTPHRYLVRKGPLHEKLVLAPNMWGAEYLPQAAVLPLVDLVITHGATTTVTEAMHFGVPMIVMPLFWDQHDNAQRVQEQGYGLRLDPYRITDKQLQKAVKHVLGDGELRARLTAAGTRIRAADGLRLAADRIEQVARAR